MYHSYVNVYREPPVLLIPKLERWGQWPKQMTATKEAWASRLHTDLRILRGSPNLKSNICWIMLNQLNLHNKMEIIYFFGLNVYLDLSEPPKK